MFYMKKKQILTTSLGCKQNNTVGKLFKENKFYTRKGIRVSGFQPFFLICAGGDH